MKQAQKEYQKLNLILESIIGKGKIEQKRKEKFEQNNNSIALIVLFPPPNTKAVRVAYRSKYDCKGEKQVILLMIIDGIKWHYLAVTKLSALLEGKLSNHHGCFFGLNYFNSYSTKNELKEHKEIFNNRDSYRIEMSKWFEKILKYNSGEKSLKATFAIYLDLVKKKKKRNNLVKTIPKNLTHREKLSMSLQDG